MDKRLHGIAKRNVQEKTTEREQAQKRLENAGPSPAADKLDAVTKTKVWAATEHAERVETADERIDCEMPFLDDDLTDPQLIREAAEYFEMLSNQTAEMAQGFRAMLPPRI